MPKISTIFAHVFGQNCFFTREDYNLNQSDHASLCTSLSAPSTSQNPEPSSMSLQLHRIRVGRLSRITVSHPEYLICRQLSKSSVLEPKIEQYVHAMISLVLTTSSGWNDEYTETLYEKSIGMYELCISKIMIDADTSDILHIYEFQIQSSIFFLMEEILI